MCSPTGILYVFFFFFLMIRRPPRSPLFPPTPLFRSDPAHVRTADGHSIIANALVIATNSPVNDWVKIHTKQAAYRTYVIGATVPRGSVPRALYWDKIGRAHV